MNLEKLEEYFSTAQLPEYIQLDSFIEVETKKTVESHINFLKGNPKNKLFQPYYDRLMKIYYLCKYFNHVQLK